MIESAQERSDPRTRNLPILTRLFILPVMLLVLPVALVWCWYDGIPRWITMNAWHDVRKRGFFNE